MMAKDQNKIISVGHSFRYREKQNTYEMQLRHKKRRWWLLLFLLPLLLLIQCHKDVTVVCIDAETGEPIAEQKVTLSYDAHYLFKSGFFTTESHKLKQTTDKDGKTVFRKVPCSVFSYLFYCLSDMTVSAKSECYEEARETCNFHFTSEVELKMTPLREDLYVKLLDKKTGDPLPYSTLVYTYVDDGIEKTDSVEADARGVATIPQMSACGVMKRLLGRCVDHVDTTRVNVPCQDLLEPNDEQALRLVPVKEKFGADVVLCIDCTGSMDRLIGTIKNNAMNFYADIQRKCLDEEKEVSSMRIRVIGFRDWTGSRSFEISPFYKMPDEEGDFKVYVSSLMASGGGDDPELGYDALCQALQSDWSSDPRVRRVVILWTDAESHPLSPRSPVADFTQMSAIWNDKMKDDSKRLIIYAPAVPTWTIIETTWPHVVRHDVNAGGGLRDVDYEEILRTISKSI
jgi:hypothetical protein